MRSLAPLPALLLSLAACGDDGGRTTAAGMTMSGPTGPTTTITATSGDPPNATTADDPTTAVAESTATGLTTTDDSGPSTTTGALKFDLGGDTDLVTTGEPDKGCKKVDFMFVIDNSASMEDNQAALIASFPGFITAIKDTLSAGSDYQIMVVDTDADGRCKRPCDKNGNDYDEYCASVKPNACMVDLDACDTTRGAGVVHPVGLFSSNVACPIAGGNRFMLPEEPDLQGTFACVATVGTAGNASERPMNGMTEAVSPALNGPGGCNQGFVRDDAILVVLFISDDPNYEDEGEPQAWYDAVLAAKQGNKDAVVVAGLIPPDKVSCNNKPVKTINGAHWAEFIAMWGDHGLRGSVCEADYAPFFTQAVAVIDDACDNFEPPG